jgi:transposase
MAQRFRTCDLDQPFLMPPSLQDWLPENHLARFIAHVVNSFDLSKIEARYVRNDGRGKPAWHPVMMVRLLLYGYAVGVRSSRRIEKATHEDIAFRYLAADQHPDHDTIADFRKVHLEELSGLFLQGLRLCEKARLVKLGQVAIDGTKVAANASKQASHSYEWLSEHEKELAAKVKALLEEADAIDRQEDERFGKGKRGEELPEHLATAERQLKAIVEAKQELEREAREKAEQTAREKAAQDGKPKDEAQKKRWQRGRSETPAGESKGNLTDPESRLMVDGASKAFVQAFNAQIAVAGVPQIIVGQAVVQEPNDKQQLTPMVEQVVQNVGKAPDLTLADAGYWDENSVAAQQAEGRDVLVPPDGPKTSQSGKLPVNAPMGPLAQAMRQRLADQQERKRYRKRNGIVEPVFGWIKNALGYRRFLLRGLAKVRGEWALICTVINLGKLFRYGKPCQDWLLDTAAPA